MSILCIMIVTEKNTKQKLFACSHGKKAMHLAVISPSCCGARTTRALMMCLNASKYSCRVRTTGEDTTVRVRLGWGVS